MGQLRLDIESEPIPSRSGAVCAECGGTYTPYRRAVGYQKYCSPGCRKAVWDRGEALGAHQARDEALERVRRQDFMRAALEVVQGLPAGIKVTGEEVRKFCEEGGVHPHHHNAWGALMMQAVKRGLLKNTERYVAMQVASSHARKTPVYERGGK